MSVFASTTQNPAGDEPEIQNGFPGRTGISGRPVCAPQRESDMVLLKLTEWPGHAHAALRLWAAGRRDYHDVAPASEPVRALERAGQRDQDGRLVARQTLAGLGSDQFGEG
jgi:hypothetical protein